MLATYLQPVEQISYRRKVRLNATRKAHLPNPFLNDTDVHAHLDCARPAQIFLSGYYPIEDLA